MAHLDINEIVKFFASVAERLGIEWRFEIEGSPFGTVTTAGPDAELQEKMCEFLELFPGNFETLRSRSRGEILAEWSDR